MPALPSSILEPLWDQFAALLPTRQVTHPLGCHRPRIPDRIVFDKLIQVLVFGCGYRRIDDATCPATTLRRRRDEWIALGLADRLHPLVLSAYDRMLGLQLDDMAVDGCITKAPCGGQTAGRSPVDRGKQGLKRSVAPKPPASRWPRCQHPPTATTPRCWPPPWTGPWPSWTSSGRCPPSPRCTWTPAMAVTRPAPPLTSATLPAGSPTRAPRPDPGQQALAGGAHPRLGNNLGKLRWCTKRNTPVVEFWISLAHAIITLGRLLRRAWTCYRWQTRPRRRP